MNRLFYILGCEVCGPGEMAAINTNFKLDLGNKIIITDVNFGDPSCIIVEKNFGELLTPTTVLSNKEEGKRFGFENTLVEENVVAISVNDEIHHEIFMNTLKEDL